MTEKKELDGPILLDPRGKPIVRPTRAIDENSRTRLVRLLLESTVTLGIGTAVMYFLGYVYYQNLFGVFGPPLMFPPLSTSEYLTKAFDLATTPFVLALAIVWIITFVLILDFDEDIRRLQVLYSEISQKNRQLGSQEWQIWRLQRRIKRQDRKIQNRLFERKDLGQSERYKIGSLLMDTKAEYPMNLNHMWLRFFPLHVTPPGVLAGLVVNLYLFLTIALVIITAIQLDAMNRGVWIIAGTIAVIGLCASLLGRSAFHILRENMKRSLASRLYFAFITLIGIVFTTQFLAASVGKHDARQFLEGQGSGSYLTIIDTQNDRPDLEGRTFRVLLQRAGDYYLVPSDQASVEHPLLIVVPRSEVVSQTTEPINP